eukprot:s750_g26.t1
MTLFAFILKSLPSKSSGHGRLIYLYHLARHGSSFHCSLLLMEYQQGRGWLLEVQYDLAWLAALVTMPFDVPQSTAGWPPLWEHLSHCSHRKSLVKRACRKHLRQERIARDAGHYHDLFLQGLTDAGYAVYQGDQTEDREPTATSGHQCSHCDMRFASAQALASHSYQVHGPLSLERQYGQSTICPGCPRDHHTNWRLARMPMGRIAPREQRNTPSVSTWHLLRH